MPQDDFKNIALVRLSSIGDVIFAMPALALLRETYPQARITWIVEDRAADLLRDHSLLDEVLIMPRRIWKKKRANGASRTAVLADMRAFGKLVASRNFDLAIDFQGNLKSGLVTRATKAPVRLGYGKGETKEPNWLFTNRKLRLHGEVMHRMERDIRLLGLIGIAPSFRWPPFTFAEDDRKVVDAFIGSLPEGGPIIVLNPGTSAWFKCKRWDPDYYASLADYLVLSRQARVVINWGPDEIEVVDQIMKMAQVPIYQAPDLKNMRQVGYLMSQADLVVGSDTGPVHLAAAQRIKTIILFGPYDPRFYYPFEHKERAVFMNLACSPCRYRTCPAVDCMRLISPTRVAHLCDAVLDDQPISEPNLSPNKGAPT